MHCEWYLQAKANLSCWQMASNSSLKCDVIVFETRRFHYQHAMDNHFFKRAFAMKSFQNRSREIQKRQNSLYLSGFGIKWSLFAIFRYKVCWNQMHLRRKKNSSPIIQENNLICSITKRIQLHTQMSYLTTFAKSQ